MRRSEFWIALGEEFGEAYGRTLAHDLVLTELGSVTASEALAAGVSPREVWHALCSACDVPLSRRHGVGRLRDA